MKYNKNHAVMQRYRFFFSGKVKAQLTHPISASFVFFPKPVFFSGSSFPTLVILLFFSRKSFQSTHSHNFKRLEKNSTVNKKTVLSLTHSIFSKSGKSSTFPEKKNTIPLRYDKKTNSSCFTSLSKIF